VQTLRCRGARGSRISLACFVSVCSFENRPTYSFVPAACIYQTQSHNTSDNREENVADNLAVFSPDRGGTHVLFCRGGGTNSEVTWLGARSNCLSRNCSIDYFLFFRCRRCWPAFMRRCQHSDVTLTWQVVSGRTCGSDLPQLHGHETCCWTGLMLLGAYDVSSRHWIQPGLCILQCPVWGTLWSMLLASRECYIYTCIVYSAFWPLFRSHCHRSYVRKIHPFSNTVLLSAGHIVQKLDRCWQENCTPLCDVNLWQVEEGDGGVYIFSLNVT